MTHETIRRTALLPLLVGAAMLCASTALAEGEGTTIQGPDAAAGVPSGTDCVAAGGETVEGMPATEHQEQVLKTPEEQIAEMEPAAGCPDAGEMPATEHQQDVLQEDGATTTQ
jgi:hypothetical protein